jgi:DNA modification methylase
MNTFRLLYGDVIAQLSALKEKSVQCVVTSPPYWGLRDYGIAGQIGLEPTPEAYVARLVEVFRAVRRVLRDDGTLWLNLGDSYATGTTSDRKPTQRGKHGYWENPAVNKRIDGRKIGLKPKDLVGIPWRVAFALQADGWWLRSDIIWAKPNPMPESVTDRPTKAHEYVFLMTKSARYFFDADAVAEPATYAGKVVTLGEKSLSKGQAAAIGSVPTGNGKLTAVTVKEARNVRSVWSIATEAFPEAHFATFPEALVERCVKAGSQPNDWILDPFCGSGTTGKVALELNRNFVGIDLNPEYLAMARRRCYNVAPMFNQEQTA